MSATQTRQRNISRWNPLSWSLWLKMLIAFVIMALVIALPATFLIVNGIHELSNQNVRSFLSENSTRQLNAVSSSLERARNSGAAFVNNEDTNRTLTSLLLRGVQSLTDIGLRDVRVNEVNNLFSQALLNPATSLFESVRLLDRHGQVISHAGTPTSSLVDQSNSTTFLAASAPTNTQDSILVISTQGFPIIEYVHKVYWRDGSVLGYVVTQVSNSRSIYANIRARFTVDAFRTYTFLVDDAGTILTSIENRPVAVASQNSTAVTRALLGQSGTDTHTIAVNETPEEMLAFYAPIQGTSLAFVSQVPTSAASVQTLDFLSIRGFVLALGLVVLSVLLTLILNQLISPPLARIRRAAQGVIAGDYDIPIPDTQRGDEIGATAVAFDSMRSRVHSVIEGLENRVAERTRDIEATQDISVFVATQRNLDPLMAGVVNLIIDRFPQIYHAQVFLIDNDGLYAIVRSSTGEVGQRLMERGHRLAVGGISVIGQVTDQGKTILAKNTAASQVHRRNEFLPDTNSELAIPLRVGETIIGALDVQSKQSDAFPDDLIGVLETMANQIAIAIQNARLYEESLRRVAEIEDINRQATLRAWQEYMREQRQLKLTSIAGVSTTSNETDLRKQALASGKIAVGGITERNTIPLAVPIKLRNQTLGAVEWEVPQAELTQDKLELAQELANRLALSLDNARLFQESRRATERERLVNNIAARLTQQTNIEQILQTAVREVGQALRAPQVTIKLRETTDQQDNGTD